MKIAIIGAGPAGLYFARLRKLHHPLDRITIYEQNAAGSTFGFGVSIADRAVNRYQTVDPVLAQRISEASLPMPNQRFTVGTESYLMTFTQHGAAIERQNLLNIMAAACSELGVEIRYSERIEDLSLYADADLMVGADGANSVVLARNATAFAPTYGYLQNRYAWYGVKRMLPEAGLSFRRYGTSQLVGHYYPYTSGLSTFVAEIDGPSWDAGFGELAPSEQKRIFEQTFAHELEGECLIENHSIWRQFRHVSNVTWHSDRCVLLGDALAVAHYSIGSGTRLAMDDALALFDAFELVGDNVALSLPAFETSRRPVREKLMLAASKSWDWYEDIANITKLPLMDFIHSFMTRTGRMAPGRLAKAVPQFASDYEAYVQQVEAALGKNA